MRRRKFITLFGAAAVWPRVARAQQPVMPVSCLRLGISETRWKRFAPQIEQELISHELQAELKKNVLFESTTAELLQIIRNEENIDA